ncbi:UDP-glucuronic acid decarboxylase family protein [Methanocaldococcus fervens]|uniref:UDP-glucuronate decarboxylase n=1 Tax=Methanocaldococcus fervens (strain DSM 4213 / JCM 15782 / AG86) TaxID=573064 RepID=C7P714_METFA|nr:UDP-glucuronic acid decarboxylase family protein [Methanocaldococcus fervens]ACV24346.1 NAD-dependent epimerase/dehydratase [Methanocaldococcus fervens AG86]
MKTILVTGGAGFIGTNLIKRLLEDNNKVICIDNNYTGRFENIKQFLNNPNFKFIKHDITKPIKIEKEIDEIYNLACPASPPHYQKSPIFTLNTSIFGIINILELAKKHNAKVLHASTSEVYGNPLEHPQKESYWGNVNPIGPRACYDEGKRVAETYCYEYWKSFGLDIRIVRIFNTYGPYVDPNDGRVVSNFIIQALKNEPLTVYGDGKQTRSFQYIDDLVEGMLKYMEVDKNKLENKLKDKFNWDTVPVLNMGNPEEFTILELAYKVLELIPESESDIVFKPLPKDDPVRRRPDITMAKEVLGWEPKVKLEEGLKKTIEYFRELFIRKGV